MWDTRSSGLQLAPLAWSPLRTQKNSFNFEQYRKKYDSVKTDNQKQLYNNT